MKLEIYNKIFEIFHIFRNLKIASKNLKAKKKSQEKFKNISN